MLTGRMDCYDLSGTDLSDNDHQVMFSRVLPGEVFREEIEELKSLVNLIFRF